MRSRNPQNTLLPCSSCHISSTSLPYSSHAKSVVYQCQMHAQSWYPARELQSASLHRKTIILVDNQMDMLPAITATDCHWLRGSCEAPLPIMIHVPYLCIAHDGGGSVRWRRGRGGRGRGRGGRGGEVNDIK